MGAVVVILSNQDKNWLLVIIVMKNPLEGQSSLSTPGLLLGTIASVGSGGRDDDKKSSGSTFERRISSGKENDPHGAGSLKRTMARESSFLNRSSLASLETPATINKIGSLDRRQS